MDSDSNATTTAAVVEPVVTPDNSTETSTVTISKLKENIRAVVDKMNEVCKVNSIMLKKIQSLDEEIVKLNEENDNLYDELYDQKVDLTSLNQYGRRENVEFCNVPESVSQEQLNHHITEVMKSMGIKVNNNTIHVLHRIGKSSPSRPRNVIVRFTDRKTAFTVLKKKKKLNDGKFKRYYVTENLCPYNKLIFNKLYARKKNNEIHSLWSFNGNVFVKVREGDERFHVKHLDDIPSLFADDGSDADSVSSAPNQQQQPPPPPFDDHPDHVVSDHAEDAPSQKSRRRSSLFRSHPVPRRLSIVDEESEAENSLLRTPIPPLIIKV